MWGMDVDFSQGSSTTIVFGQIFVQQYLKEKGILKKNFSHKSSSI